MADTSAAGRKKQETRERLIEVATRLFLTKGFDNTTIEDIAAVAGVSGRTFFRYFLTKEHVVFHDQPQRLALFRNSLLNAPDESYPFDRLKTSTALVADYYDGHRTQIATEFSIVAKSPSLMSQNRVVYRRMEHAMARGLRQFRGKPFLTARQASMVAAAFLGAHRATVWEWINGGCRYSMCARLPEANRFIDVLANAIGATDRDILVLPDAGKSGTSLRPGNTAAFPTTESEKPAHRISTRNV